MAYWKPILVLLKLRRRAASNDFAQNPTAILGRVLLALFLGVVGLSLNIALGRHWPDLSPFAAEARLSRLWLEMQIFWILGLLIPGVVGLLGPTPCASVLRAFPLRPSQTLLAELLGSLLDTPTLLAVISLVPFLCHLCLQGRWGESLAAVIVFGLLGLLTAALVRLLAVAGALMVRRMQRWAEIPAMTALLLFGLCVCVPPAFASLTTAPRQNPNAIHVELPSMPTVAVTSVLPSTLACRTVVAVRRADYPGALGSSAMLAALMFVTMGSAFAVNQRANLLRGEKSSTGDARAIRLLRPQRTAMRADPLSQLLALLVTDLRLLLRSPGTYLPLRQPAAMLLLGVLVFLAPDMGRDPVYSFKELLGLGGVLYNVLWQIQLLCNRFGSESGTATMLFSLSIPRWRLLLGKNFSLMLLLLVLDSAAGAALCVVAEAPNTIPVFLLWLGLALVVLTGLGNIVSVFQPFSIVRSNGDNPGDAPDSLAFVYVCVGAAAGLLLVAAAGLFSRGWPGAAAALTCILLLYFTSLYVASRLIKRRERRMIARLDRNGL